MHALLYLYRPVIAVTSAVALALPVVGCNERAPVETAGRQIDKAIDRAADEIDQVAAAASVELKKELAQASEAINDATVTAKVKSAILSEPQLKMLQINVETVGGVVILTGSADTRQSRERAEQVASAIAGVKSVDNRIDVKGMV